jgi:hypothetical protein
MSQYFNKKYALFYFILALLFRYIFVLILPLYIKDPNSIQYGIDAAVLEMRTFNIIDYVISAKPCYKDYWDIYFPLDTVFPVVYSLLFMSIADFVRRYPRLFKWIGRMVLAGAIFDWSENVCIGIFVNSYSNGLATAVAFLTSIKSILFALNIISSLVILLFSGYLKLFPGEARRQVI